MAGAEARPDVASSGARIAAAGNSLGSWYKVLDLPIIAKEEDIKRSYRKLSLLHHPDKPDGDADIFKLIKEAYEKGMLMCQKPTRKPKEEPKEKEYDMKEAKGAKEKGKAKAKEEDTGAKAKAKAKAKGKAKEETMEKANAKGKDKANPKDAKDKANAKDKATSKAKSKADSEANSKEYKKAPKLLQKEPKAAKAKPAPPPKPPKPKPWVLPKDATKAKIRSAVDKWQSSDRRDEKTKPEDVQTVTAEDMATDLFSKSCILVDLRASADDVMGPSGSKVKGAVHLSFSELVSDPDEIAPSIEKLRKGKPSLVLMSDDGRAMGPCGMAGAMLLDVFSFNVERVRRLQGGFAAWSQWLEANQDAAKSLAPAPPKEKKIAPSTKDETASRKRPRPKAWDVADGKNAGKVHKAIHAWETCERFDEKTLPDQVPLASPAQTAEWLRASACVAIDARRPEDVEAEDALAGIFEAVPISFYKMVFSPMEVVPQAMRLKADGKRLVIYTAHGERMDACGLLGTLLIDVFGFSANLVYRLEGGCAAWDDWLDTNKDDARTLEPLAMRLQRLRKKNQKLIQGTSDISNGANAAESSSSAAPADQAAGTTAMECDNADLKEGEGDNEEEVADAANAVESEKGASDDEEEEAGEDTMECDKADVDEDEGNDEEAEAGGDAMECDKADGDDEDEEVGEDAMECDKADVNEDDEEEEKAAGDGGEGDDEDGEGDDGEGDGGEERAVGTESNVSEAPQPEVGEAVETDNRESPPPNSDNEDRQAACTMMTNSNLDDENQAASSSSLEAEPVETGTATNSAIKDDCAQSASPSPVCRRVRRHGRVSMASSSEGTDGEEGEEGKEQDAESARQTQASASLDQPVGADADAQDLAGVSLACSSSGADGEERQDDVLQQDSSLGPDTECSPSSWRSGAEEGKDHGDEMSTPSSVDAADCGMRTVDLAAVATPCRDATANGAAWNLNVEVVAAQ